MTRIRHIVVALSALLVLAVAAPAAHASYRAAIRDCADDGLLQGTYTKKELLQARSHLPASLEEYSDCSDVLRRALAALARSDKHGRGGGEVAPAPASPDLTTNNGAVAGSPQQFEALKQQQRKSTATPPRLAVAGQQVSPGTTALANAGTRASPNDLPVQLLVALLALALLGAVVAALAMRHHWPKTRRVALQILRR